MKAILLFSSIFYLLGLKLGATLERVKKLLPAKQSVVMTAERNEALPEGGTYIVRHVAPGTTGSAASGNAVKVKKPVHEPVRPSAALE